MLYKSLLLLTVACTLGYGEEFLVPGLEVQLKDPIYRDGILSTTKGGVIKAPGLRLQAQHILYAHDPLSNKTTIFAMGDLLLEHQGHYLTGTSLEYDVIAHTGTLLQGRMQDGIWFIGGDTVHLSADGSIDIHNAFVTTSENEENNWSIEAKHVTFLQAHRIKASHIRFTFLHIPMLWLPSFQTSTEFVKDPPLRYRLIWDKGVGPRATLRYRVFTYEELAIFARLDYRLSMGFGGAIESEYQSKDRRTSSTTRSYAARDKVVFDETTYHRYRLQGIFDHMSLDEKTKTHLSYDKLSDLKMISDFPSSDFEIDTERRTILSIKHHEETFYGALLVTPRLNPFDSINQKLPLLQGSIKPFTLGTSGILSENRFSLGYLNYVYASDLTHTYPTLRETHAARVSMHNLLYRPFHIAPLHITPSLGLISFLYSNNEQGHGVYQTTATYGGTLSIPLIKRYDRRYHHIEPYMTYEGVSVPTTSLSHHYIFMIEDGLYQLNRLTLGCKNRWLFATKTLDADIFAHHFFFSSTLTGIAPKAYLSMRMQAASYLLEEFLCWNFQESVLDTINLLGEFTYNEHLAFILEYRHRSRFDFRKANHDSFFVDMARSIEELVDSPLSDKRNTFLAKISANLSPKWTCSFGSHYGWGRNSEPSYASFKIDTTTLLSSRWELKFSYTHTTNDDRFAMQMQLHK